MALLQYHSCGDYYQMFAFVYTMMATSNKDMAKFSSIRNTYNWLRILRPLFSHYFNCQSHLCTYYVTEYHNFKVLSLPHVPSTRGNTVYLVNVPIPCETDPHSQWGSSGELRPGSRPKSQFCHIFVFLSHLNRPTAVKFCIGVELSRK